MTKVTVTNWNVLKDQFTNLGKNYYTPMEIGNKLANEVKISANPVMAIDYEKRNVDSGICLFNLIEFKNSIYYYEYTGTAK